MQSSYQAIEPAEDPAQRRVLDRAVAEVRFLARQLGVKIFFFGSYAEERVHTQSNLNIAIPDDLTAPQRQALEDALHSLSMTHHIKIEVASRIIAENLGEYLIP